MLSWTSLPCLWSSLSSVHSLCFFHQNWLLKCNYYVATHADKKESLVAIMGTWAVEHVVTDITALPVANSVVYS